MAVGRGLPDSDLPDRSTPKTSPGERPPGHRPHLGTGQRTAPPPVNRMTDGYKKNYLAATSLRAVKIAVQILKKTNLYFSDERAEGADDGRPRPQHAILPQREVPVQNLVPERPGQRCQHDLQSASQQWVITVRKRGSWEPEGLFTRTVSVSVSVCVTVKFYHCVKEDGPLPLAQW